VQWFISYRVNREIHDQKTHLGAENSTVVATADSNKVKVIVKRV